MSDKFQEDNISDEEDVGDELQEDNIGDEEDDENDDEFEKLK